MRSKTLARRKTSSAFRIWITPKPPCLLAWVLRNRSASIGMQLTSL